MKHKQSIFYLLLLGTGMIFSSWGYIGHEKISKGAEAYFEPHMNLFHEWTEIIAEHSSDADRRKSDDKSEGPKHYLDIDNYPEFIATGTIPYELDTLVARYGGAFVKSQGYLPWATLATFDSIVASFIHLDMDKAVLLSADLSHYVADGHMPLHITQNYDGQQSNNDGIHSRYESKMISRYADEFEIKGGEVEMIEDVKAFVFNYLYTSYLFVDTILLADDYAKSVNSNVESAAYNAALWEKTESCTRILFENASNAFADLLYTAWMLAGAPDLIQKNSVAGYKNGFDVWDFYFNEKNNSITIDITNNKVQNVELVLYTLSGNKMANNWFSGLSIGEQELQLFVDKPDSGIYLVSVKGDSTIKTNKLIIGK